MVDGMKTVAMYQRHLQISIAPPLWLNVKKATQKSCNSAKVSINYAFLESVVRSVSVFSFVHPIQGTLIDFIIIRAVDLARTYFLALVIYCVLVFSRGLLFKKKYDIYWQLGCFRGLVYIVEGIEKAQKWCLNSCPSKNPYYQIGFLAPWTFKFLYNPTVSLPYPYFSLLLIHC